MGISVGNLHYHHANKNEVIKGLQAQFLDETDLLARKLQRRRLQSYLVYQSIVIETFRLIHRYRFLFNDRLTLYRKIPEIKSMFKDMLVKREKEFYSMIEALGKGGLLRTDLDKEHYAMLFKQIVILYNSWGSHISLFETGSNESELPAYYAKIVSSIWIPYFSEEGMHKFGLK